MEPLNTLLQACAAAVSLVQGGWNACQWMVSWIRKTMRDSRTRDVLRFLHDLGALSESDVRKVIGDWARNVSLTDTQRDELTTLLSNLTRGARFHTTQGTPVSSYLRCERLIEQLLTNIQPKRQRGQEVGPGWREWQLERFLGMGTYGEVWLGRNALHPRPLAFKFFTIEGAKDWLQREQQALFHICQRLGNHPNIVGFNNVVIGGQWFPFLALEYVSGGSLEDWILSPADERVALNPLEFMTGIARGLAQAHDERIYHRDLKPANILLTEPPDCLPKIADFGLAKAEPEGTSTGSAQASQGVVVGTRMYLPPEANDPFEPRQPAQDDVFAFGVIWYQLLVNRLERPPYDFADRLRQADADALTVRLVARCLAHPEGRFTDAGELLDALNAVIPDEWTPPEGCLDVGRLAADYLNAQAR
jgi:serine/threonine protein kinase